MFMVWPLDENQGPSQLHGHGPWFVCELALNTINGVVYDWKVKKQSIAGRDANTGISLLDLLISFKNQK